MALRDLEVPFDHTFSSDICPWVRQGIQANFPPLVMYDDLTTRDQALCPYVDFYIAGFPCQPFSHAGAKRGFEDARGKIFYYIAEFLRQKKPRLAILEKLGRIDCFVFWAHQVPGNWYLVPGRPKADYLGVIWGAEPPRNN